MPLIIEDGLGSGQKAGVSPTGNRFNVSSRSDSRAYYISRDFGDAFTVTSHDATAATGTIILYYQNTSTTNNFVVNRITVGGVSTILWKVHFVTGTATGSTLLIPTNLNRTKNNAAAAIVRGDGPVTITIDVLGEIGSFRTGTTDHDDIELEDSLILGENDAIGVEVDDEGAAAAAAEVTIQGYYEDKTNP